MTEVVSRAVAVVVGGRQEILDDGWDDVDVVIRLDPAVHRRGPHGLDEFSHVEVVFHFHRVPPEKIETGARHPRGNTDWPLVGIFAQRGKNRPNRLGVSRRRLHRVTAARPARQRPRRDRRHAGARHQAVHGRVRAAHRGPPARLGH